MNPPEGRDKCCPCGQQAVYNPDRETCRDGSVVGKPCMRVLTADEVDDLPLMGLGRTHNSCSDGITNLLMQPLLY